MAHPKMYDDDDPVLASVRAECLAFPESTEVEAWGRPTFRAGKKIFALYSDVDETTRSVIFKPAGDERAALLQDPRCSVPPYWGPGGWLALALGDDTDWDEVRELVEDSYRQVALKRMIKALDDGD